MILKKIKYYFNCLQKENYKSFNLSFLRVAISVWLLSEIICNYQSLHLLYGPGSFFVRRENAVSKIFPGGFTFLQSHYLYVFIGYFILCTLNILGIGRRGTALLLFLMVDLVQKMNMPIVNGGNMLARLILLYLVFADSWQFLVLFKTRVAAGDSKKARNLLSNLAALSLMFHLCLIYFASGLAKLNTSMWYNGEATYYALSLERFSGTALNQWLVQYKWFDLVTSYAVLLFELLFPILIWIKPMRKSLLIAGVLFHLSIAVFLMIYNMELVFILVYAMFLPNRHWLQLAERFNSYFTRKEKTLSIHL